MPGADCGDPACSGPACAESTDSVSENADSVGESENPVNASADHVNTGAGSASEDADPVGENADSASAIEDPANAGTGAVKAGGTVRGHGRGDMLPDIEDASATGKRRIIISLTWPALAENLLASLVSMIDMIMVSALGTFAISAVGLVTQPRFILLAAFMALNVGSTAMVARFKGAREQENACKVLNQSLLITAGITVCVIILMLFAGEPLIRFLAGSNISEQTVQAAIVYLRIQVYGFPTLSFTFCINAILRGAGNTRAAFYNNAVANVFKIFFNFCLIDGNFGFPALGIAGASVSSVIAQTSALCMAVFAVARGREYITFKLKMLLHADFAMIRRIMNIGVPALVEQVIMRTGMMLFTVIVTSLGDNPYASHMIAMNVQMLSFTTGMAFGITATTLVGQCLGRLRADLAKIYVKITQNINMIISVAVSVLMFAFAEWITSMYSDEAEIIRLAALMLRIIAIVNPISNARFVFISALRGAGDSRFAAVVTFIGVILVRPVIGYGLITQYLPFQLGLLGVWIGLTSDSVVCYIVSKLRYARGVWANIQV